MLSRVWRNARWNFADRFVRRWCVLFLFPFFVGYDASVMLLEQLDSTSTLTYADVCYVVAADVC